MKVLREKLKNLSEKVDFRPSDSSRTLIQVLNGDFDRCLTPEDFEQVEKTIEEVCRERKHVSERNFRFSSKKKFVKGKIRSFLDANF